MTLQSKRPVSSHPESNEVERDNVPRNRSVPGSVSDAATQVEHDDAGREFQVLLHSGLM